MNSGTEREFRDRGGEFRDIGCAHNTKPRNQCMNNLASTHQYPRTNIIHQYPYINTKLQYPCFNTSIPLLQYTIPLHTYNTSIPLHQYNISISLHQYVNTLPSIQNTLASRQHINTLASIHQYPCIEGVFMRIDHTWWDQSIHTSGNRGVTFMSSFRQ